MLCNMVKLELESDFKRGLYEEIILRHLGLN